MRSFGKIPTVRWTLVCGVTLAMARLSLAGPAPAPVTPSGGPQIMLYISQPLGSGASRRYGLRLENQGTIREGSGLGGPLRQQPLLALQFNAEDHMQLKVGRNMAFGHDASGWHPRYTAPAAPLTAHAMLPPVALLRH